MGPYRAAERSPDRDTSLEDLVVLAAFGLKGWEFWNSKKEDIKAIGEEAITDLIKQPGEVTAILESSIVALEETVLDHQIEQLEERLGIRDKRDRRISSVEEKSTRLQALIERASS